MRSVFFLLMAWACLFALVASECTLDDILRCEREIESENFTFSQYFTLSRFLDFLLFSLKTPSTPLKERERERTRVGSLSFNLPHFNEASQIQN